MMFVILTLVLWKFVIIHSYDNLKRYEYKYSFKGPYLAQKDGSVPFWSYSGNTIATYDNVRVVPSLKSQKGSIWTKTKTSFNWWQVEIVFRVTGRGRIGADGLAFWFTEDIGTEGPVYGNSDNWKGLGLFFDSYDNDNKKNNPYILAIVNDGTMSYDHDQDGSSQQIGGCMRDFRNKPHPVRAKIEYYQNVLTLWFFSGSVEFNANNPTQSNYELCFTQPNVILPTTGYFGLSAATGGLADDHDILQFVCHSLIPVTPSEAESFKIAEDERKHFVKEYEDMLNKMKMEKEEYEKQHPEAVKKEQQQEEYETGQQRELSQIFQGQGQIFNMVHDLHRKIDEIIGRQERTMNMISSNQIAPSIDSAPLRSDGIIKRTDIDQILTVEKEIIENNREIRFAVKEIQDQFRNLIQSKFKIGTNYDSISTVNEIKVSIDHLKEEVTMFRKRIDVTCQPSMNSCIGITALVLLLTIHVFLILGYLWYRERKENQTKKFY